MTVSQTPTPESEAIQIRKEAATLPNDDSQSTLANQIRSQYQVMSPSDQKVFTAALHNTQTTGADHLPSISIGDNGLITFDCSKPAGTLGVEHDLATFAPGSNKADQTKRVDSPDGSHITTYGDGTVEASHPDHSAVWISSDKYGFRTTMSMAPDGTANRSVDKSDGFFFSNNPNKLIPPSVGKPGDDVALKVPTNPTEYLVVPTKIDTGVEDPQNQEKGSPNYFADAWNKTRSQVAALWLEQNLQGNEANPLKPGEKAEDKLPRDFFGVALNSEYARDQNQYHLHVDKVPDAIRDSLRQQLDNIPVDNVPDDYWQPLTGPLSAYKAKWVDAGPNGELPGDVDPVKLVHNTLPGAADNMELQGIAAVGENRDGRLGFVVLVDTAHDLDTKKPEWGIAARIVGH